MTTPRLQVTFTVDGDNAVHVKEAVRIKVDGRGGLTLYRGETGASEWVNLDCLASLTIRQSGWISGAGIGNPD